MSAIMKSAKVRNSIQLMFSCMMLRRSSVAGDEKPERTPYMNDKHLHTL
ncbi:MAG: hypothetical protein PUC31_02510 [Bacteroidales bacterium]|nr:hypothetical protein [Bacteroidales bacterium]